MVAIDNIASLMSNIIRKTNALKTSTFLEKNLIKKYTELESQPFSNLKSVGFGIEETRIARSKRHCDFRGLIVFMIHKSERNK
ncbi:MAG: hypothetical protein ACUVUH_04965 [bacterium]